MKLFLLLACVFFVSIVSAQPTILEESYMEDLSYINDLKGPVKECILNEYTIYSGRTLSTDTIPKTIRRFDEHGRLIELLANHTGRPGKNDRNEFKYTP